MLQYENISMVFYDFIMLLCWYTILLYTQSNYIMLDFLQCSLSKQIWVSFLEYVYYLHT